MSNEQDDSYRERLKAALWYTIGKNVDDEALDLEVNVTPQFIGALTEMVFTQVESVTKDLESFSRHANRNTITTDDVLLLARRNAALEDLLREFVEEDKEQRDRGKVGAGKGKGKGKAVAGTK